ncbi:MAG: GGDEF domain-containing protein [Spirochaeta sp.]|nr:GGDEF domain-containing protein [Spirochaeta sp.]
MALRRERNTWGVAQFVLAAVLAVVVLRLWYELNGAGDGAGDAVLGNRGFMFAGFAAALAAGWFGHSSYPRVYNFKIYVLSVGVAVVSLAAVLLIFLGPRVIGSPVVIFYPATVLVSYLCLLFVFVVTVIAPEYLGYHVTRKLTLVIVGIILGWYALGLGIPVLRRFLAFQLTNVGDAESTAFWALSSAAAVVLFLSLFTEAHSTGIGGIHAGGVLLLSVGWLAPGSDILLHAIVITALPVLVAVGTLIHWLRRLENRASYDPLLRIYNRGWFDRVLDDQSRLDTRPPFSIALIDLDHFKAINDTHGHDAGDTVLREVAQRVRGAVLPHGTVARFGGEELAVFLPQHDETMARDLLEAARRALAERPVTYKNTPIAVTGSFGYAVRSERGQPLSIVLQAADRALYAAKDAGRNQVKSARLHRRTESAS